MNNSTDEAYNAHPDRYYLIGAEGKVFLKGGPGPFGFKMKKLEAAIRDCLGMEPLPRD